MVEKHLICPQRIRKIPKQFSWLDHRLVRDHYIDRCSHSAAALYLFLVTVADAQGLSYYSDRVTSQRLDMDANTLAQARQELIRIGLIAYQKPLYQVLALDTPTKATNRYPGQLQSLAQIFKQIGEGAS
jgi:replication initiation and membrane attachment protein DnaB